MGCAGGSDEGCAMHSGTLSGEENVVEEGEARDIFTLGKTMNSRFIQRKH